MALETSERNKPLIHENELTPGVWAPYDGEGGKGDKKTKEIKKSAEIVGQILGLIMGDNFTIPACKISEENPFATTNMTL